MLEIEIDEDVFLPRYRHLIHNTDDINFLFGGRDSGKSQHIAQRLVMDCLMLPYFRCMLIKKTYATIQESQWQTIKDVVERWNMSHLFSFKTSPLRITCLVNGNHFIARGCDNPQSIKSTKDPSHAWYEEGNQLDLDDFITVTTTLRTDQVKVQQWFSFNPECDGDFEDFWLYKIFFKDKDSNGAYSWVMDLPDGTHEFKYTVTHSNYKDNEYCSGQRIVFLEQLKDIDPYYYQVYTLGLWGRRKVDDPYCHSFDREKHVRRVSLIPKLETILSFDFNVNPITCGVYQHYRTKINCIEAIKLEKSDIYRLCDYIKTKYPRSVFLVTGDATGRNTTALVQDAINYYTVIKNKLHLGSSQLKVPTVNPPVDENRVLVNAAFQLMEVSFDPDNAKGLIFDCQNVSVTDLGKIEKGTRTDPKKRSDHLDNFRYYLNSFHKYILKM